MKKYLIAGLLVWLPLAITVWVLSWLLSALDGVFLNDTLERPLPSLHSGATSIPPGVSELLVGFPAQDAYQAWNDHFAARVRLGSTAFFTPATSVEPVTWM